MRFIADLHIHSKYSRATSTQLDLNNLEKYAIIKGVNLLGTGDFTHPLWIKELQENLHEDGTGFLRTKSGFRFVLQSEISLVFTQGGKGRRVHIVMLAPNFFTVQKITQALLKIGRIDYDGRPIFKLSCIETVKMLKNINPDIEIIPAHIWTPWFGLLGSKSGFDSLKEAFGDYEKDIYSIETGLSSNPPMNHRLSQLDNKAILSFSDLHTYFPWRLGRESTIFDIDDNYKSLIKSIRTNSKILGTIEVDPNYGKYHFDGHRNCNISFSPKESQKHNGTCPVCKKPLTIGVLNRVEELADRPEDFIKDDAPHFFTLIPLSEIIAKHLDAGVSTKKVWGKYMELVKDSSEYDVMLDMKEQEILDRCKDELLTELILKNRKGKIKVIAGYDGEYGVPSI